MNRQEKASLDQTLKNVRGKRLMILAEIGKRLLEVREFEQALSQVEGEIKGLEEAVKLAADAEGVSE